MNKESAIKLLMLAAFLSMFLFGSRFKVEDKKVICIEGKCLKPHDHGELNYHDASLLREPIITRWLF